MSIYTETEVNSAKAQFLAWIDAEICGGVEESDLVLTSETADDVYNACITIDRRDTITDAGFPVELLERTQRQKGEPRKDIYVADFGTFRLAFKN